MPEHNVVDADVVVDVVDVRSVVEHPLLFKIGPPGFFLQGEAHAYIYQRALSHFLRR